MCARKKDGERERERERESTRLRERVCVCGDTGTVVGVKNRDPL